MKRKIFAGLAVAATLFVSLCLEGSGDAQRKDLFPRRAVIDGRSFVSDESPPEESDPPHPVFSGRLKESPRPRVLEAPPLPAGLTADHTLRMEGDGTPVDLVFGRLSTPGPSIRSRLLSSGWKSVSIGRDTGGIHMLQVTPGKETTIVCLDEAEGTFLLFREVGR